MHELAIPQTYVPGASDNDPGLWVIAVQPAGSAETALQALVIAEPGCALGLASLARAQPELAVALYRLIDELDGLAYRHPEQGLLPLAGEPLCQNLPAVWPDADDDGAPDPDTVAEWLTWFGDDAQRRWSGLSVTTDRGHWRLGDPRPMRAILTEATTCRITRAAGCPSGDRADLEPAACRHGHQAAPGHRCRQDGTGQGKESHQILTHQLGVEDRDGAMTCRREAVH